MAFLASNNQASHTQYKLQNTGDLGEGGMT